MNRLETTILKNLIFNDEFTRKVLPFINSTYFLDRTEKNLFNEIHSFVNQYKNLPTTEALIINFTESKNYGEDEVRDAISLIQDLNRSKDEPTETN